MRAGRGWALLRSPVLWAAILAGPVALFGLHRFGTSDFLRTNLPALNALRAGHVGAYLDQSTVDMGSYLLRLPLILLPNLWAGGSLALYRLMALPALAGLVWLGPQLWWRSRRLGAGAVAASIGLVLFVLNPFVLTALVRTHPEDLVGGMLCVAAVLSARRDRATLAGVVVGLAIANKAWALVAVVPVLWLLSAHRFRALVIAGAIPVLALLPLVVRDLTHTAQATAGGSGLSHVTGIASTSYVLKPWNVWWFFGDSHHLVRSTFGSSHPLYRSPPEWITHISHPLAIIVPLAVCLWVASRMDRRRWTQALLLLALALQLRCMFDAWNIDYYQAPFTIALLAWELLERRRVPVISFVVIATGWVVTTILPFNVSPDVQAASYLAWSIPTTAWMLWRLLRAGRIAHDAVAEPHADARERITRRTARPEPLGARS